MRARIHRGAKEVGGVCVELAAASGERLLLDLGLPLDADSNATTALPPVVGLSDGDGHSLLGVVLSHGHPDHYGLIEAASPAVPLWAGKATTRILWEAAFFSSTGLRGTPAGSLADRTPIQIGPFEITPFLVDHSAFDSYALLVAADGRRLFYSGDLRGHGRKSSLFERLLREPPRNVNAALLEGTTLGRKDAGKDDPASEREVEERATEAIRNTRGMTLACYSPQNVDRLVSVYRAAVRAGRELVMDLYAATIAAATGLNSIPQAGWSSVRVYVPMSQRLRVKEAGEFWRVDELGSSRIFIEELSGEPDRWVMSFRGSMLSELQRGSCLRDARALWMMWPGYLGRESGRRTLSALERLGIQVEVTHASGHASIADLQRLAKALEAERVVPIHTDAPNRFPEFFERIEPHPDGEWWEV